MPRQPETQAKIDRAVALRKVGLSYKQIGDELGVAETTARSYCLDPDGKLGMQGRKAWKDLVPIPVLEDPLWRRQPKEPIRAWKAFELYRDTEASERSYQRTAKERGVGKARVHDWSKLYRWQERITAWEAHCEELKVRAQEKAIAEMGERQAVMGMNLLLKAHQRLIGDSEEGITAINMNLVGAREVAVLAEAGAKLERLGRGVETERVENSHAPVEIKLAFNATPNLHESVTSVPELPPAA